MIITLYGKFETYIPRYETARPHRSQFLHSCICERFIYSHDWPSADRSWEYIYIAFRLHVCGKWETENYNSDLEIMRPRSFIFGNTEIQTRHLYWILTGPSFAVYTSTKHYILSHIDIESVQLIFWEIFWGFVVFTFRFWITWLQLVWFGGVEGWILTTIPRYSPFDVNSMHCPKEKKIIFLIFNTMRLRLPYWSMIFLRVLRFWWGDFLLHGNLQRDESVYCYCTLVQFCSATKVPRVPIQESNLTPNSWTKSRQKFSSSQSL